MFENKYNSNQIKLNQTIISISITCYFILVRFPKINIEDIGLNQFGWDWTEWTYII